MNEFIYECLGQGENVFQEHLNYFGVYQFKNSVLFEATPIYLLVLRAQEVGNEPFWNIKKKLKNVTFLFFLFFLESDD